MSGVVLIRSPPRGAEWPGSDGAELSRGEVKFVHRQRGLERSASTGGRPAGPAGFDARGQAAAGSEFAANNAPDRLGGFHDIAQDAVDSVFVKDSEAAIPQQIHFQGLQLEAEFLRLILNGDGAVVRKPGLGADRSVFGKARGDGIAGELVGPGLEARQPRMNPGAGVFGGVIRHSVSWELFYTLDGRCARETTRPGANSVALTGSGIPRYKFMQDNLDSRPADRTATRQALSDRSAQAVSSRG